MKITEKALLDGYDGKTNGGDNISIVNGIAVYWAYRTGQQGDGYNCVCDRDRAGEITLEYDRTGTVEMDADDDHPTIARIASDEQEMWGDEVPDVHAAASALGSIRSLRKAEAARRNGRLGGRPKKQPTE